MIHLMSKYTTMITNNKPFSLNKIPFNVLLVLLTLGASLILGFLSFGGMYALMPALGLAFAAFGLSVAYEGEIYLQNIKGALNKLLKKDYLENYLAKEYLLAHFPQDLEGADCPQFFKDYMIQLRLLKKFGHKTLNQESQLRKRKIEKKLKDMERWFALQLFSNPQDEATSPSNYALELRRWLTSHEQDQWQNKLNTRKATFYAVLAFSLLAGTFMGLGTTYLIVEAFAVIPLFATIPFTFWPILILPMAIIAGGAYAMLTYNSITDLINNDTIRKWFNKIRNDLSQGFTVRNVFLAVTALFLVTLAIALTVCTAGTWWTVATKARPLFAWMSDMPSVIMGVINPIITGLSAIFFNVENTAESLSLIDEATKSETSLLTKMTDFFKQSYQHVRNTENWWQIVNPFRLLLKLTIMPLRIIFFMGHLISIAVTADRMPGVPTLLSAFVAIISEGFEDAHYFVGHSHDEHHHHDNAALLKERLDQSHGHNHNVDIPTFVIKSVATPIYFLAAVWDYLASRGNQATENSQQKSLTFIEAWNKQRGVPTEDDVRLKSKAQHPSAEWQREHAISLIERHKSKQLQKVSFGKGLANDKLDALTSLQKELVTSTQQALPELIKATGENAILNQHRLFACSGSKTKTQTFVDELPERISFN
jgi:hypothetical protein